MAWAYDEDDLRLRLRLAAEARGRLAYRRGLPPPLQPPRWVVRAMQRVGGHQDAAAARVPSEVVGWRVAALGVDPRAATARMDRATA